MDLTTGLRSNIDELMPTEEELQQKKKTWKDYPKALVTALF